MLKDGKFIKSFKTSETNEAELIKAMGGRDIGDTYANLKRNDKLGDVVLEVNNLKTLVLKDVSFKLHKGEILGFAGLVGAGRTEVARALFGADDVTGGEIKLDGKPVHFKNPREAIDAGIALCPEDRKDQGLVMFRSINDNVVMPVIDSLNKGVFVDRNKMAELAEKAVEKYSIKTPTIDKITSELSGGNQQKVILGRWTSDKMVTKVLILDEPTKGIDVGTKAEIYQMVCDFASQGIAVIFISSELTEVINLADNIVVMHHGHVTGILSRQEATEEKSWPWRCMNRGAETMKNDGFFEKYIRPVTHRKVFSLILILLALVILFSVWSAIRGGQFFKASTIKNILNSIVLTAFLAIGAGCLLISGALDLSQAAVGAFGGVILAAAVANWGLPWWIGIIMCLVFCGILGAGNAVMVTKFRFPPFIATLAMMSMAKGLMYVFSAIGRPNGSAANVSVNNNDYINFIGKGFIGPVPFGVIVMIIFFIFYGILMSKTKFGLKVFLMGGNPAAANLAGINSKKISFILFINSAVLGGVAGVFSTGRLAQGSLLALQTNQFTGLTAAILAASQFGGGSGAWAARLSACHY